MRFEDLPPEAFERLELYSGWRLVARGSEHAIFMLGDDFAVLCKFKWEGATTKGTWFDQIPPVGTIFRLLLELIQVLG